MLPVVRPSFLARRNRNADALAHLETFLVCAVVSFLGIRAFLAVTGYPQVGGAGLHVAHMLWGGLLMLVALGMLLIYLDHSIQWVAAAVAGLGFGTFIDEIGKFLTSDNNYFFRPAVALIYVVFIGVFLLGRALIGRRRLTPRERLANALDLLEEHLGRPIEEDERAHIRTLLHDAPADVPLTDDARRYLDGLPLVTDRDAWLAALPGRLTARYARLSATPWFDRVLTVVVVVYALLVSANGLVLAFTSGAAQASDTLTLARLGEAGATLVGALCVLYGALLLRVSRARAYQWFLRSLLIWMLVAQVFVFYISQLAGIGGLAVDLVAYASFRLALAREERRQVGASTAPASGKPG